MNDYNYRKYYFYKRFVDFFREERKIPVELEIKSKKNLWKEIFQFFEDPNSKLADIIEIPHQWTTLLSRLGIALPLTSLFDKDYTQLLYPFLKTTMLCDGTDRYFSLPVSFEVLVMFYRKDMIEKIASYSEMKSLKWNDIFILCEKLKKRYKSKDYYPFDNPNLEGYITPDELLGCIMNRRAGYFSSDFTMVTIHRDEVVLSVVDFLELAAKRYYPLFEENFFEVGFIKKNLSSMIFSFRRDVSYKETVSVRFPDIMRTNELGRATSFIFFSGSNELDEIKSFISEFYKPHTLLELAKILGSFSPFNLSHNELLTERDKRFYEELFDRLTFIPNIFVYPTFENMMDEFLRKQAVNIVNSNYNRDDVRKGLAEIKGVCEYLMRNY